MCFTACLPVVVPELDETSFAPGSKVKDWKVQVNKDKGWVKIGGNKSSLPKLNSHFGKEVCGPIAVTRLRGRKAAAVCPHFGQPGHTHGGVLHNLSSAKLDYVQKNMKEFRWRAKDSDGGSEAPPSSGTGSGSGSGTGAGSGTGSSTGTGAQTHPASPKPRPVFSRGGSTGTGTTGEGSLNRQL